MVSFRAVSGTPRGRTVAAGTAAVVLAAGAWAWRHGDRAEHPRGASAGLPVPGLPAETAYVVAPGDTLGAIAAAHGTSVESLMALNGLADPDALMVGQSLLVHAGPAGAGPPVRAVPDSAVVFGRAYLGFDLAGHVTPAGSLAAYTEVVDGQLRSGTEIVATVARDFSVGPRVLLAQVEAASNLVTAPRSDLRYPAGLADPAREGLWRQLNWLADRLNRGYYDWATRDSRLMLAGDGVALAGDPGLGPGSFAVQSALAALGPAAQLETRLAAFQEAYSRLFGDPFAAEVPVPSPSAVEFPPLVLPWEKGQTWWFTGGPHGGWAPGSAAAALDFVPPDEERGCFVSPHWATAAADGTVLAAGDGALALDLDGDGARETGPVLYYLHLAAADRVAPGTTVRAGERLGHPSCEGGRSDATHLHLARLYDGVWLPAGGPPAFVLGGWTFTGANLEYEGAARSESGETREACACRDAAVNGIR